MNTVMLKSSVVQGRRGKGKLPGERAQCSREREIIWMLLPEKQAGRDGSPP